MTCCHRSKVLPTYLDSMTYMDIQRCLTLLIRMNTLLILSARLKASYYNYKFVVYRR
jgi:hypothetical protein